MKMRYSLEPRYRKHIHGLGFMSFAKNIGNKYGRKIFDKSIDVSKSIKMKPIDVRDNNNNNKDYILMNIMKNVVDLK